MPLCGTHPSLARVNPASNSITAVIPVGPALSEGGIAASKDSVWMVYRNGKLARVDAKTNRLRETTSIPRGAYNAVYSEGNVWVTGGANSQLIAINASTGKVIASIPVGSKPRFLTTGGGMVWTLNQGDGSVSKINAKTKRLVATIAAQIPGGGGDITYGERNVWATIIGVPLTKIDARTNAIRGQWGGRGGDAVRFGHGSLWLTDYFGGKLWRINRHALRTMQAWPLGPRRAPSMPPSNTISMNFSKKARLNRSRQRHDCGI